MSADLPHQELDYLHKLEKELIRNDDSMIQSLGSQETPIEAAPKVSKLREQEVKQPTEEAGGVTMMYFNSQSSLLKRDHQNPKSRKGYLSQNHSDENQKAITKIVKTQLSQTTSDENKAKKPEENKINHLSQASLPTLPLNSAQMIGVAQAPHAEKI